DQTPRYHCRSACRRMPVGRNCPVAATRNRRLREKVADVAGAPGAPVPRPAPAEVVVPSPTDPLMPERPVGVRLRVAHVGDESATPRSTRTVILRDVRYVRTWRKRRVRFWRISAGNRS